jgi:hypothetical protein
MRLKKLGDFSEICGLVIGILVIGGVVIGGVVIGGLVEW